MASADLIERALFIKGPAARQRYLRRYRNLLDLGTVELLKAKVDRALRDDIRSALTFSEVASEVADILGDSRARALAGRARAHALQVTGNLGSAIASYDCAAALFQAIGDEVEVARTWLGKIDALIYLSRYDEAHVLADRCYSVFEAHHQSVNCGKVDLNRGNIYQRLGQHDAALGCYLRAREAFSSGQELLLCALADSNLGNVYTSLAQFQRASQAFRQARQVYLEAGLTAAAAMNESNDGLLSFLAGDFTTALSRFSDARERLASLKVNHNTATVDLDAAELYYALNLLDEADEAYARASDEFRQLGMRSDAARAMSGMAVVAARRGHPDDALKLLDEARSIFAAEDNALWAAIVELHRAAIELQMGRLSQALERAREARASLARQGLVGKEANARLLEGHILERLGDLKAAAGSFRRTIKVGRQLRSQRLLYEGYYGLARVTSVSWSQIKEHALRQAIAALERIRTSLTPEELKITYVNDKTDVYSDLILLLLRQDGTEGAEQAFAIAERGKSQALVDLLGGKVKLRPSQGTDEALLTRIDQLRAELNTLYSTAERREMQRDRWAPGALDETSKGVAARERELARLQRRLELSRGEYASLTQPAFVGLPSVQQHLPEDSTLLEYFVARGHVSAFAVTARGVTVHPSLADVEEVEHHLERLAFQLRKFNYGPPDTSAFSEQYLAATRHHLAELYRLLIQPLRHQIRGRRLIVVPAGVLNYVPFQALCHEGGYLLDDYELSYAPSASVLTYCSTKDSGRAERLFLMAVEDPSLPYVMREASKVAELFPLRETALGSGATLDRLLNGTKGADIVHIASHAVFRKDNPLFSRIKLADGWFSARDTYNLQLSASLVTLSACETGVSEVMPGDELLGLARGFFYAGAPSLLVSLWTVNDEATAELMGQFYARLRAGDAKASALRQAQLEVRDRWPHPYYWAPFVLVGKGW